MLSHIVERIHHPLAAALSYKHTHYCFRLPQVSVDWERGLCCTVKARYKSTRPELWCENGLQRDRAELTETQHFQPSGSTLTKEVTAESDKVYLCFSITPFHRCPQRGR